MSYPDETHDDSVDLQTVLDAREQIRKLDDARIAFEEAARKFAEHVAAINPDFLDRWEYDTRAYTGTTETACTDFVEAISSQIDDYLLDHAFIERTRELADQEHVAE